MAKYRQCHGVRRAYQLSHFLCCAWDFPQYILLSVLSTNGVLSRQLGGLLMLLYKGQVKHPPEKYVQLPTFGIADLSYISFVGSINQGVLDLPYPAKWGLSENMFSSKHAGKYAEEKELFKPKDYISTSKNGVECPRIHKRQQWKGFWSWMKGHSGRREDKTFLYCQDGTWSLTKQACHVLSCKTRCWSSTLDALLTSIPVSTRWFSIGNVLVLQEDSAWSTGSNENLSLCHY